MKTGFTCGAFDLCHAGHILMLEEAKSICDYLIVGLHTDPSIDRPDTKKRPIQTIEERLILLNAIKYIDEIVTYDTEEDLYNLLKRGITEGLNGRKIGVRIMGADWRGKHFTGNDLPIEIYFNSRNHNYSTTELRRRVYEAEKEICEGNN